MGKSGIKVPDGMRQSDKAMGDAAGELRRNQPGDAVGSQKQAVDKLREAMQALADQARGEKQAGKEGEPGSDSGSSEGAGDDPLGRDSSGGLGDNSDVKIPDDGERQKSREVLDELRRRSGQRERPRTERDYIERLLEEF